MSNGYDAGARRVHVLLPEQTEDETIALAPLWVIDDGHGMDEGGFHQLWRVADSNKATLPPSERAPIGQFGIGKLAAYVLAWRLTHVSRVGERLLMTSMDFHKVTGRQNNSEEFVGVSLREVDEATAKEHLAEIEPRDPDAWAFMFDEKKRSPSWTAAALTDFKDLYNRLTAGRLRWVLRTGLPLHADFMISVNGDRVVSSKEDFEEIKRFDLDEELPKIGKIAGTARIHKKQLTTGKSEQFGRSNGFFIRVRGRVINLEDELFGIQQPNHAAWSRFTLEVEAPGLRDHLLSSREGVRDSKEIQEFREYLLKIFNKGRTAYEEWNRQTNEQLDIVALLSDSPSVYVTEPLSRSVRNTVETGSESFYIAALQGVEEENRSDWLLTYESEVLEKPFNKTEFVNQGTNAPALRYHPTTRSLVVNPDHPFIDKLTGGGRHLNPARLLASSEVLLEGQLQDHGVTPAVVNGFLRDRDRVLRLMAGEAPPTAKEVLRMLRVANQDRNALERATGAVFQVLGFEYERKGGSAPGPDGVLYARLGRHGDELADYKLVYDAKQTNHPSVPADKVDVASLDDFRKQERAKFGFFIAAAYAAETELQGAVNRRIKSEPGRYLTLLKIEHLERLIWLHFKHGVTLTELRSLFEKAHTVLEVNKWIDSFQDRLAEQGQIPLRVLFEGLEKEKSDPKAMPNVNALRAKLPELQPFEPGRLTARLKAVENIVGNRWIIVDDLSNDVFMHAPAEQLIAMFEHNIVELEDAALDKLPGTT